MSGLTPSTNTTDAKIPSVAASYFSNTAVLLLIQHLGFAAVCPVYGRAGAWQGSATAAQREKHSG